MARSHPFSVRLSPRTDELVTREARRTRRSKGAVLENLADEALRTRRFPGVAFRGSDWNRRAWVIGTALDVWEIVGQGPALAVRGTGDEDRLLVDRSHARVLHTM
ncbi:MAG: hypothetical protein ACRD2Z_13940 [Thermoanaerobaculia bacterium]